MQNRTQQFAIGIDIGGTGTKYGIVNHRGVITYKGELATNKFEEVKDFVAALHEALKPAIETIGKENIKGIGVGAPNGNFYTGTIDYAPNLHWKGCCTAGQVNN
jgi:glucokinase